MQYKLNISREEYRDDYAIQEDGELWQIYAKDQLITNLKSILKDAMKYKLDREQSNNSQNTWLSHNAILVTSPRGSGKTVFLRNCEHMWKQSNEGKENNKLFFLDVIDPTMLMDNDSFANVIIAQIYQAVSDKFHRQTESNKGQREDFSKNLRKLADSLSHPSEFDGSTGIDKILKYNSGIQIENNFHQFVESAIKVLDCAAIVVLIDDVDMALDKAFEVVDSVRRFLGCPYIIPVVSGDLKLYEHMTQIHFDKNVYSTHNKDNDSTFEVAELSKTLTTAYLTKVFPSPSRISLFSIDRLVEKLGIFENEQIQDLPYADYQEILFNQFNYLCHNRDARRNWVKPESARELTQLVRTIRPSELIKSLDSALLATQDKTEEQAVKQTKEQLNLLIKYKNWAIQKKDGEAFAHAESAISLLHDKDKDGRFSIEDLLAFNIRAQADRTLYPWANYKVYESQSSALEIISDANSKNTNSKNANSLISMFFNKNSRILKAMPPLEFPLSTFFISNGSKKLSDKKSKSNSRYLTNLFPEYSDEPFKNKPDYIDNTEYSFSPADVLLDLYTENELYSTHNSSKKFIFFSRAFELLFFSFLKQTDESSLSDNIQRIIDAKPFYSIIKLAETKNSSIIDDETEEDVSLSSSTKNTSSDFLSKAIREWQQNNEKTLSTLSIERLIPIFSYCFNGTFTALNVLKANHASNSPLNKKNFQAEHLSDMVQRFKYTVLNAILRAGIYGEAIYANVLIGAKSETVRDILKVKNSERTHSRNKKALESEINKYKATDEICKAEQLETVLNLHDLIEKHPIFNITEQSSPLFKIGIIRSESEDELQELEPIIGIVGIEAIKKLYVLGISHLIKNKDAFKNKLLELLKIHGAETRKYLKQVIENLNVYNLEAQIKKDGTNNKYVNLLIVILSLDINDAED